VRYSSYGTLQWRVDLARVAPSVGRLLVDAAGNAYLAFNSVGDGQDIQLHKYNVAGVLVWSQVISTGFAANDVATSLALSPDGADVVATGNIVGGATWIVASFNAATGARRWVVTSQQDGINARDLIIDATRVYVTGEAVTDPGTPAMTRVLTVVAYDRASGARRWKTIRKPADAGSAAGLRMVLALDGSIVVTGQANRGFLDWYTLALDTTGAVRWEAIRDGGLNTNEIPASIVTLSGGAIVVTGPGGPNLPGGFIPGVAAAYDSNGSLLWEAFAAMATVWATALPSGDVCATGGYDALVTCWSASGAGVVNPPVVNPPVLPTAPEQLIAQALTGRSIRLSWSNTTVDRPRSASNAAGERVARTSRRSPPCRASKVPGRTRACSRRRTGTACARTMRPATRRIRIQPAPARTADHRDGAARIRCESPNSCQRYPSRRASAYARSR
jgi:outer membrane protein assembly factor BamB